jgi:arabinogalactan oligomer/maltooligosaccharide transport system permease protein
LIINNDHVPFKKFWRTLLILPWAVPAIISQMVFNMIFNETGVLNATLESIGVYDLLKQLGMLGRNITEYPSAFSKLFYWGEENIQWFHNPHNKWFVRSTLIVVNIWLGFPYYMALMSGVMVGIDRTLYEAAEIDGATKGQRFRYITFPLVMYSTAPLLVMSFSGNFNNFGVIYFITEGGANAGSLQTAYAGDTDILISWMYTLTVDQKIYNMASVFSILIFIVVGSIAAWNYSQTRAFKED